MYDLASSFSPILAILCSSYTLCYAASASILYSSGTNEYINSGLGLTAILPILHHLHRTSV